MKLSYKYRTLDLPVCLMRMLKRRMRWVRAAGGIVTAPDGDMLLILRNGRWDLPKGKVESGETLLQAAMRETLEETGVATLPDSTGRKAPIKTYHIFNLYGGWHLKQTSWFALEAADKSAKPQLEEGITEVQWVGPAEWHRRLGTSYGTLRTLAATATDKR